MGSGNCRLASGVAGTDNYDVKTIFHPSEIS